MLSKMQGIEILKKTAITSIEYVEANLKNPHILQALGILLITALIECLLFFIIVKIHEDLPPLGVFLLFVFIAVFFVGLLLACEKAKAAHQTVEIPTGKYEYEVLIEDTSLLKEIYENYEVIGTKGDIYILRDKNPETPSESEENEK